MKQVVPSHHSALAAYGTSQSTYLPYNMADLETGSKSVAVPDAGLPQQRSDQAAAAPSTTKGKFKIYGKVVMAMKRFQASLNPTYSYGKRTSDSSVEQTDGHRVLVQPKAAGATSGRQTSGRTASGRTASGRPTSAGQHHGYKGSLLFRPLPHPDTAVPSS